jgi:hypothetical protein
MLGIDYASVVEVSKPSGKKEHQLGAAYYTKKDVKCGLCKEKGRTELFYWKNIAS